MQTVLWKTRLERVRNADIWEEIGIHIDVTETVEVKRLNWFGHVQRMYEHKWPKEMSKWGPFNGRKRGRPKRIWKNQG